MTSDSAASDLATEALGRYASQAALEGRVDVEAAKAIGIGIARDHDPELIDRAFFATTGPHRRYSRAVLSSARTYVRGDPATEVAIAVANALADADVLLGFPDSANRQLLYREAIDRLLLYTAENLAAAIDHLSVSDRLRVQDLPLAYLPQITHDEADVSAVTLQLLRAAIELLPE